MEQYKLKWVTLVFPRDLTEHEENILIVNLKAVKTETAKALQAAYEKLKKQRFEYLAAMPVPGFRTAYEFMKARAAYLSKECDRFFILGKKDNRTYYFGYAWEDLKAINANFSLLNRTFKLPEPSLVNETLLTEGLKRSVFPSMGFKADEVTITVSEKEPEGV